MILDLLSWWYSTGWRRVAQSILTTTAAIERSFSVSSLLGTLFAPWRRIVSYANRSLDEKIRAALDNLISRMVGFFVRFFVLIAALVSVILSLVVLTAATLIWPFIPLLIVFCAVRGITG